MFATEITVSVEVIFSVKRTETVSGFTPSSWTTFWIEFMEWLELLTSRTFPAYKSPLITESPLISPPVADAIVPATTSV